MRELCSKELGQVQGGLLFLPVLAAIGSFAGHQAVRSVGGYLVSRAITSYGIATAAKAAQAAKEERKRIAATNKES